MFVNSYAVFCYRTLLGLVKLEYYLLETVSASLEQALTKNPMGIVS